MAQSAVTTDTQPLRIEVDSASRGADLALGRALTRALRDAGLPMRFQATYLGEGRREHFQRSLPTDAVVAAADLTVRTLRIYLPPALAAEVTRFLVAALHERIDDWRRETGNEKLEVSIYAADNRTILSTVEREVDQ
jgi:hypothetical protein